MAQRKAHNVNEKERTDDIHIDENVDFSGMYLADKVLQGLLSSGFERPSPIQLAAIPLGRCGLDLVVQAKSGTGKTCVFAVIALEMVSTSASSTQVLVIAPTREIAVQITQVVNSIGSAMPDLRASTFIGGIELSWDREKLRCCHIAVGTPGRLTQLVELGHLKLDNVRLLVLDEADQLLSGQFREGVTRLAFGLPLNKQVICLSATYSDDVAKVAEELMRSPTHVRLDRDSPALLGVNQFVRLLPTHQLPHRRQQIRMAELLAILSTVTFNQCLVFTNSQLRAESICNQLKASGWPVSYLTGGQTQGDRLLALEALCSYKCRVLVSTDLSARGLDSEHTNLVINVDVPNDQATYLHRVGRAGRFGSRGGAITLATEGEEWLTVRAVVSLANVCVHILKDEWNSNIANSVECLNNLEKVEHLSVDDLSEWVQQNAERQCYSKSNGKVKTKTNSREKLKQVEENSSFAITNIVDEQIQTKNDNINECKDILSINGNSNGLCNLNDNVQINENPNCIDNLKQLKNYDYNIECRFFFNKFVRNNITNASHYIPVSHDEIHQNCMENYDNLLIDNENDINEFIPSLPNISVPTNADLDYLSNHLIRLDIITKEKVLSLDNLFKNNNIDIHSALQDMIEGKNLELVLEKINDKVGQADSQTFETKSSPLVLDEKLNKKLTPQKKKDNAVLWMNNDGFNISNNQLNIRDTVIPKESLGFKSSGAKITGKSVCNRETFKNIKKKSNVCHLSECWKMKHEPCNKLKKSTSSYSQSALESELSVGLSSGSEHTAVQWDKHYLPKQQPSLSCLCDSPNCQRSSKVSRTRKKDHKIKTRMKKDFMHEGCSTIEQDYTGCTMHGSSFYQQQMSYFQDTQTFASMMEYVKSLGRSSALIAKNYHDSMVNK